MSVKHIIIVVTFLFAVITEAYQKPIYGNMQWKGDTPKIDFGNESQWFGRFGTIPEKNDLLDICFNKDSVTVDTTRFYALPDNKKEVIIRLYGINKDDGVKLKAGQVSGSEWNCFEIEVQGPPGGQVALIMEGSRENGNKHFRIDKQFILDGTKQKLVFQAEFPSDLLSFGLRLDLKNAGKFTFWPPEFKIVKKAESKVDSTKNYIFNGGAENGFDNTMYLPLFRRAHAKYGKFINYKGEAEDFNIDFARDTTVVHSGKYAFRLKFSGNEPMTSRVDSFAFNPVPIKIGEMITYTIWVRAERPTSVDMGLYLGDGTGIANRCSIGTDWTKLQLHVPSWGNPGAGFQRGGDIANSYQAPAGLVVPTFVIEPNVTVWFDDASVSLGEKKEFRDENLFYFRECRLDKDNHCYNPQDKITAKLNLENVSGTPMTAILSGELFDFFGKPVKKYRAERINMPSGQELTQSYSCEIPKTLRGPLNLVFTLDAGDKGKASRTFYLGVVENEKPGDKRFSLEASAEQNVREIIPFFKAFGIGAVRIGCASGTIPHSLENAEFFHQAGIEVLFNYSLDKAAEKGDISAFNVWREKFRADLLKYKDFLTVVESQNEANLGMTVKRNVEVIKEMKKVMQDVAPNLKLAGPDPCGTDFAWIQGVLANGAAEYLDIVSEHPYRNMPEQPDYGDDVSAVRKIIDMYKKDALYYATEAGRVQPPSLPDNRLNDYVRQATALDVRNMLLGFGNGLDRYSQFSIKSWQIGIAWNSVFMGTKETDGALLPAPILFAMRNASDRIGNGKAAGRIKLGYNYRAYLFAKGQSSTAVIWKFNGEPAHFKLADQDDKNIRIYDFVGSSISPSSVLELGEYPVYLEAELAPAELEKVIKRANITDSNKKMFSINTQIISSNEFEVTVKNMTASMLEGLKLKILEPAMISGASEVGIARILPEEKATKVFRLNSTVTTTPSHLTVEAICNVPAGKETMKLNLQGLLVPKTATPIRIDGDLSDWTSATVQAWLTAKNAIILEPALWGEKENSIKASLQYAWDNDYLYIAVTVYKISFNPKPDGGKSDDIWKYDSLQVCFDPLCNGVPGNIGFSDDDFEYSLGMADAKPVVYRRTGSSAVYDSLLKAPGITQDVNLAVKHDKEKTVYEMAFARRAVSPFKLVARAKMRSSILININENGKRIGYLELTPGIGKDKLPGMWMDTILLP